MVIGVVVATALAGASYAYLERPTPDAGRVQPSARGYRDVGTVDGVTFWVRIRGTEAEVRTSGRLGDMCDATGPSGYTGLLLCAAHTLAGGVAAGFVPDQAKTARVDGKQLRIVRMPGPDNLAVDVVGPAQTPPRGRLVAG